MLPYWLLFLLPVFGAFSRIRLNHQSQMLIWLAIWLVFSLVVGLRHEVGGDWMTYFWHFEHRSDWSFGRAVNAGDPGYYAINWLVAQFGGSIYWVNLICAAAMMAGVVAFCRNQPAPWVALAVAVPYLIIVVGMGYTRQAAALGLLMLGLVALSKERLVLFVFWVMLAATFHKSAVLMLPVAALASAGSRLWSMFWVGLISLLGGYLFVFDSAETLWTNYVEADYQSQGGLIRVLMNSLPAVLFLLLHKRLQLSLAQTRLWWWMSVFALVCIPLVVLSSTATDRVALYLIPLQLFVFSRLYFLSAKPNVKAFIVLAVLGYYAAVQAVWLIFAGHSFAWLPYQMLWFLPDQTF